MIYLKYNQGHWKQYEWVKLNKYYHHAKFDIYYVYSVWEICNVETFATYGQIGCLASWLAGLLTLTMTYTFFHVTQKIETTHLFWALKLESIPRNLFCHLISFFRYCKFILNMTPAVTLAITAVSPVVEAQNGYNVWKSHFLPGGWYKTTIKKTATTEFHLRNKLWHHITNNFSSSKLFFKNHLIFSQYSSITKHGNKLIHYFLYHPICCPTYVLCSKQENCKEGALLQ